MAFDKTLPTFASTLAVSHPQILSNWVALESALGQDHDFSTGGTQTGKHTVVTMSVQSTPAAVASTGKLYAKDVDAKAELHYLDEDGDEIQITRGGYLGGAAVLIAVGGQDAHATLYLYADEGDDDDDKWRVLAQNDGSFSVSSYHGTAWGQRLYITPLGVATLKAYEGQPSILQLLADEGDDNADWWRLKAADGGAFTVESYATGGWQALFTLTNGGALTLSDGLTAGGNVSVTGNVAVTGNITVTGTVDSVDVAALKTDVDGFPDELKNLTTAEIQQLENIGASAISATEWGYLASMDQAVTTTSDVDFDSVNANDWISIDVSVNSYSASNCIKIAAKDSVSKSCMNICQEYAPTAASVTSNYIVPCYFNNTLYNIMLFKQ